ncbi:lytic transglycosylase domain-containing protein [Methylotenera sp. 1P/1]|jgi:soluble lytic murein transglycosylase|uniref:lytic transglycosylase domain-containing protein n=1 Tax=Methylotenera sp. 1P/1 TaxID=1131551 RepID=UPI0003694668|nr:lytic transglycosylase domain-containing protein [Methylotenera sp. 1P/1]
MSVYADTGDDEVLLARAAYDKKNSFALADSVNRLKDMQHVLAPYAEYWLMLLSLDDVSQANVSEFLTRYDGYPFADRFRGEWLKKLAKQQNWAAFLDIYPQYQLQDPAITCYAAEANAAVNDGKTLESAKVLWFQAKEQPTNCNVLFDKMQAAHVITEEDLVARFRMALAENRVALAKGIAKRSPAGDAALQKQIDAVNASPSKTIAKKTANQKTAYGKELYLYALNQLARTDSAQALSAFKKIEGLFNAEQKSYFYGRLALLAAQRHEPEAYQWFRLAENTALTRDQLDWYARAALRQTNWDGLLEVVAMMPTEQSDEATWRYWKARALKVQNQMLEANGLFAALSTERHFYGWLAQEELEASMRAQPIEYVPDDIAVNAFAKLAPVLRAEALQRLAFRWEAKLEWTVATDNLSDEQLIVAAEYAARNKWYDLAVITADQTKEVHNFNLRYPTPYRDLMKDAASEQNVDEAWVYGIIRQESRFMHYAKSGVGASGLMQIMPATAKWVANKVGWSDYNHGMLHDLDTNISLGTYYMRYTADQFNGQETMATAAYNAGPSRAKKWMGNIPLEGAIYAETIPFSETRNYVKKVMANAHMYTQRLGLVSIPLKKRLGVIPAKNSSELDSNLNSNE